MEPNLVRMFIVWSPKAFLFFFKILYEIPCLRFSNWFYHALVGSEIKMDQHAKCDNFFYFKSVFFHSVPLENSYRLCGNRFVVTKIWGPKGMNAQFFSIYFKFDFYQIYSFIFIMNFMLVFFQHFSLLCYHFWKSFLDFKISQRVSIQNMLC